jgi:hypothetical protein
MCADPPNLLYPMALSFFPIQQPEPTYHRHSTRFPDELLHRTTSTGADGDGRSPGELPLSDGRRRGRGGHFPGKLPSSGGGTRAPLTTSPTGSGGADAGPPVTSFCPKGVGDCDVELSRGLFATKIFLPFLCLFVLMQKVL